MNCARFDFVAVYKGFEGDFTREGIGMPMQFWLFMTTCLIGTFGPT